MTTQRLYDLAVANDDPYPDDVCPGCQQEIPRWREYSNHYPANVRPTYLQENRRLSSWYRGAEARAGISWPYLSSRQLNGVVVACEWDRDYLSARAIRRKFIREGVTA